MTLLLFFSVNSSDLQSAKKKSTKKNRQSTEAKINFKKQKLIQKLYEYFPLYEQWEKAESYFYNDYEFLNGFDKESIFSDYQLRKKLIERVNDWLGVRYRYNGRSRRGVDCSNFVSIIIEETLDKFIPAGSANQAALYANINKIDDLQFGDIIFFSGRNKKSKRIGHVGIYIGNGLFAHSSTGKGVIYSLLSDGYYLERYRSAARFYRDMFAERKLD